LQLGVKRFITQVVCTAIISATVNHLQIAHGSMAVSVESEGVCGRKQRLDREEGDRTRLDSNFGQALQSGSVHLFIVRYAI
jgi:hypothetical protein